MWVFIPTTQAVFKRKAFQLVSILRRETVTLSQIYMNFVAISKCGGQNLSLPK